MDEKFKNNAVVRDIEICKKCKWFKTVNDPIIPNKGWHWGVGVYCSNFPHKYNMRGWCSETPHAVSEEEFVRATKIYMYANECPQYKK